MHFATALRLAPRRFATCEDCLRKTPWSRAAAEEAFPEAAIKLIDQTNLIEVSLARRTAAQARRRMEALRQSFLNGLVELRRDEAEKRETTDRSQIEHLERRVQQAHVTLGTMSLVGPRPALPSEVITYRGRSWGRLGGKPGITGSWQVSGRTEISFERQVEMDIDYLTAAGIWQDLRLLAMTVPAVIGGRGAY